MTTYVALFRGINVGGRRSLPMADVREMLEAMGAGRVRTYIQSGNVVFHNSGMRSADIAARLKQEVGERHGFEPEVMVFPAERLKKAVSGNPFPDAAADPKSLHVFFLADAPRAADEDALERMKGAGERFQLKGDLFYLHAPNGVARARIATGAEKALGVPVTARNWRTVLKLLEMTR